jgi:hypothetical protein
VADAAEAVAVADATAAVAAVASAFYTLHRMLGDQAQSFNMDTLCKVHQLKNGFIRMEQFPKSGLRFYLHNNKLCNKPILLFLQGILALICALPKAYEMYDKHLATPVNKVIYCVTIASSKMMQIKLEISVYQEKLYIFLKKFSLQQDAQEEEGMLQPCRGSILFDCTQDHPNDLLQFVLSDHKE